MDVGQNDTTFITISGTLIARVVGDNSGLAKPGVLMARDRRQLWTRNSGFTTFGLLQP